MGLAAAGRRAALRNHWPEFILILAYWGIRLHNLDLMPAFFDEAIHIRWAKLAWALQPFHAASDGRLLNIWLYAAFWPFTGALWVSRAGGLIVGALGLAALVRAGRELLGRGVAALAAILYIGLPYAFFYERMALADPLLAPLLSLLVLGCTLGMRRRDRIWPILAGVSLAAIQLTKLTGAVFWPAPLLALALLPKQRGRPAVPRTAVIYLTAIAALAPVVAVLKFVARSDLGLDLVAVRTQATSLPERLSANLNHVIAVVPNYLTPGIAIALVLALALGIALRKREAAFLAAIVALPVGALATGSNVFESRFLAPVLPQVALLAGWGLTAVFARLQTRARFTALGGIVALWLALGPAAFLHLGWTAPERLPLLEWDRFQYFGGWPAGYGVREAAGYILNVASQTPVDVVAVDEGHIPTLSTYAGPEPHLHALYAFDEPNLRLLHLYPEMDDPFAGLADPERTVLLIIESRLSARLRGLRARLEFIAAYSKPGGQSVIELYRLWPESGN